MDRRQRLNLFLTSSLERLRYARTRFNAREDLPLLVSLHIPKTGGTSFRIILRQIFGSGLVYDYGPQSSMSSPVIRKAAPLPADTRCVHGHFRGIRYSRSHPEARFIYWLRHPVERVASLYEMRRRNLNRTHPEYIAVYRGEMDLLTFAGLAQQRDRYTHFLAGITPEQVFFTGILEQYDASLQRFYGELGLEKFPPNPHRNQNKKKAPIDPDVRDEIARLNTRDMALYHEAAGRFGQAL